MKRVGFIYPEIVTIDNLKNAMWKASKGKRNQERVKKILEHADFYAVKLQQELETKTYKPSDPVVKEIKDGTSGKVRTIYKPKFYPDQVVHWALMLQLEPIMMKGMYEYNCGSVSGRGTSYGQKSIRNWLDNDHKNTKYCLKMDISKFYPSIKPGILKAMLRRKIKDPECLWLLGLIIDSTDGLPIGYYTSQWLSNFVLQDMDHLIKEILGAKYYVRYVDDLIILGNNKKHLHKIRKALASYLSTIGLQLKGMWQVFKVDCRAIDFLGLRFFRNKTILRKKNTLRIMRRMRKIAKKGKLNYLDACTVISYWGWIKRSNSYYFYNTYIRPIVSIKRAKKVVSIYARLRNNQERGVTNEPQTA